jgi:outer membrane lipoprotein-sorting protein
MIILSKQWMFRIVIGFLGMACVLTACAPKSSSSLPAPKTAADVITRAKAAPLHDAAFHFALSSLPFSGNGVVTTQPHRVAITLDPTSGSEQRVYDGGLVYIKDPPASQWQTLSTDDMLGNPDLPDYAAYQQVSLLGTERINGVATWHLKATVLTSLKTATATETQEVWIRQDTYFPEQVISHILVTKGTFTGPYDATVTFTKWNTGATIPLPTNVAPTPAPSPTPRPGPFSGTPTYTNAMTADLQDGWDTHTYPSSGSCQFAPDGYHVAAAAHYAMICANPRLDWPDFAVQVEMTFIKGTATDWGAINFRGVGTGDFSYQFDVSANSHYDLTRCEASNCSHTLVVGVATQFHQGLRQTNTLGVVARGSSIAIYLNHILLQNVTDSRFSQGFIGLYCGANNDGVPAEVVYQNFQAWVL